MGAVVALIRGVELGLTVKLELGVALGLEV
jgi:hypothetical protein